MAREGIEVGLGPSLAKYTLIIITQLSNDELVSN